VALCCNIGVFERLGNVHSDLRKTDLFGIVARCMYAGIKERASKSPRDAALACRIPKGASHWPPRIISGVIEHTHWLIDDIWMRACNVVGSTCEIAQHTNLLCIILLQIAVAFPSARIQGVESSLYLHVSRAYWLDGSRSRPKWYRGLQAAPGMATRTPPVSFLSLAQP
jgi:hypothetical protein